MRCPRCQHDNPDDARYCNRCAQVLLTGLASRVNPDSFTLRGERKQVSVLFADVKASLELLDGLDPEEARNLLDPILEQMMEAVHYYEGTVNQVMGDGVMALFGAPIAHEQHAMQACCAALRMQANVARHSEALRRAGTRPPQIRIGINSGEVVVRTIESDLHMDYSAIGQTTHLAARMEQLASPSAILITANTLELTRAHTQVKPLGPTTIAGLRDPIEVYELVAIGPTRTPLSAARAQGPARLFGRAAELTALANVMDLASRGSGQVATIVGAAGVGKTALLHEFLHGGEIHGCLVLEAGCVSYGKTKGYMPVIEALKGYFGVAEGDESSRVRARLAAKLLALDPSLEHELPALCALLGVLPADSTWQHLDAGQRRQAIVHAVKALVLIECQVQPVVLVVEDLQFADAETLAVLAAIIDGLRESSLLLLASCRPEAELPEALKERIPRLLVEALPHAAAGELLDALLGSAITLTGLRQELIERTGGNPLFIEECVAALTETGVLIGERGAYRLSRVPGSLQVPASVQSILAARIDRLAPGDKWLLQAAAVIGEAVPSDLLEVVVGLAADTAHQALARLQAADFLCPTTQFPAPGYRFKHTLTHEVTYKGLLAEHRRELHGRVVTAIERLHRERIDEHVEKLAYHALRSGQANAVPYLHEAGSRALMRGAHAEALLLFEDALEALADLPETSETLSTELRLRIGLATALRVGKGDWDPSVDRCYLRALELADRLGETAATPVAALGLWACHYGRGDYERASQWSTQLLAMADNGRDHLRADALSAMCCSAVAAGWPEQAKRIDLKAPAAASDGGSAERLVRGSQGAEDPSSIWQQMSAIGSLLLGDFDQARDRINVGLRRAQQAGRSGITVLAHYLAAFVHYHRGEGGTALLHAKSASRLGHACEVLAWTEHASILQARLMVDANRVREALPLMEASLPGALRAGWSWSASVSFALSADLYGKAGKPAKGMEMLESLEPWHYAGLYGPELHRLCAVLLSAASPHRRDEAEARLWQALTLARQRKMKSLELRVAMSLARLLALRDRAAARNVLLVADELREGPDVGDRWAARALRDWLS